MVYNNSGYETMKQEYKYSLLTTFNSVEVMIV